MISARVRNVLEFNKIIKRVAEYAALAGGKELLNSLQPETDSESAEFLLKKTYEAFKLLYTYGVSGIEFFDEPGDELERAKRESTLSMGEILRVARLLKSSRIAYTSVTSVEDEEITALRAIAEAVYSDFRLEDEINSKILSDDIMSDNASVKLAEIRRRIKRLNEQIRDKLNYYIRSQNKYLQDAIVTMRGDRYVVPVKSEFSGQIKGLVHDRSASGSTLFVEPVEVLEMNNDLKTAALEEQAEIEAILSDLTVKIGQIADRLKNNVECLTELDVAYAKAVYAYKNRAVKPNLNSNGFINIINGRHPLIDPEKVVPVSVALGSGYRYLLITGPNTGGKTVTLKLVGLFSLMGASGFFIPAAENSSVCVFDKIFCDIGDEQSIEQSLSTFSSHMKNVIEVSSSVDDKSLVLLDEIGAGTDPDEGSAIARAVLERLLERNSFGIVTTHYSALKEYAFTDGRIRNASMDFDEETFAPLYRLKIGMAGSSNAIKIAYKLGLDEELAQKARSYLSENKVSFEKVLEEAEKTRQNAERELEENERVSAEKKAQLDSLLAERAKFDKDREKFFLNAKIESRRLVNESLEEAEQLVDQIKELLDKDEINYGDLIKARALRNKLEEEKYSLDSEQPINISDTPINKDKIKTGDRVYVNSMGANGEIIVVNRKKQECDVCVGAARVKVGFDELYLPHKVKKDKTEITVKIDRSSIAAAQTEINVIGQNVDEALINVENFLDGALVNGLSEVKIIHGVGLKILSGAIWNYLKKHPRVDSYRFGKYGEGEHGVTFVVLK